eukprot:TRINITY_DN4055_c1_g1_i1.p1 TRINITY_DN4055_c1_g1~~TRINITY_DN4055_c1_g1_i1.p1  ORF type:complete len:448 (-),score=44.53 TRINITY_DN4055_c1_g1_i1:402-1745(-)
MILFMGKSKFRKMKKQKVDSVSPLLPAITQGQKALDDTYSGMLARLSTFHSHTWFGKPLPLSPIECTRRGWINETRDTLVCLFCEGRIFVPSDSFLSYSAREQILQQFVSQLVSSHQPQCQWWKRNCPISALDFGQFKCQDLIAEYEKRVRSLEEIVGLLPNLKYGNSTQLNKKQEDLILAFLRHYLGERERGELLSLLQQNFKCQFMACMGWSAYSLVEGSQCNDKVLRCNWCRAEVGLWQFQKQKTQQNQEKQTWVDYGKETDMLVSLVRSCSPIKCDSNSTIAGGKRVSESDENFSDSGYLPFSVQYGTPTSCQKKRKLDSADNQQKTEQTQQSYQLLENVHFDPLESHLLWCPFAFEYQPSKVIPIAETVRQEQGQGQGQGQKQGQNSFQCGWVATMQSLLPEKPVLKEQMIYKEPEELMEKVMTSLEQHSRLSKEVQSVVKQ